MKHVIHPEKQKFAITLIAALVGFFGLEAAGEALAAYEIGDFLLIALYIYLFLVFLQSFVFDLKLKGPATWRTAIENRFRYMASMKHWLHFQNYLILPGVIYWSAVALLFLNPFDVLMKQAIIIAATLALAVVYWYLRTVFYSHKTAGMRTRHLILVVKLLGSYLAFAAVFGAARYFGFDGWFFARAVFALSFLLIYQAMFQHHYIAFGPLKIMLSAAFLLAVIAFPVYTFWNVNFYSGAVVLTAIYSAVWGIIHHRFIDRDLKRETVYEYLAVLFVILVIIFGTTNFAQRI